MYVFCVDIFFCEENYFRGEKKAKQMCIPQMYFTIVQPWMEEITQTSYISLRRINVDKGNGQAHVNPIPFVRS